MSADKHFNSVVHQNLQRLICNEDTTALFAYLDSLSNSLFRTAGYILGERILVEVESSLFWRLFIRLVQHNSKAFLVTCLKSLVCRLRENTVSVQDDGLEVLCDFLSQNEIDTQKTLFTLLPEMTTVNHVKLLFRLLKISDQASWIPFLIRTKTIYAYFVLFSSLRFIEHDHDRLVRIAYYLIKNGDSMSFNLASLIKTYFGLDEIKGTFSLNLKPYELARIETSFDAFRQAMHF